MAKCSFGRNCLISANWNNDEAKCTNVQIEEGDVIYYDPMSKAIGFFRSSGEPLFFHEVRPDGSCVTNDKLILGYYLKCDAKKRGSLLYDIAHLLAILFDFSIVEDGKYRGVVRYRFVKRK